MPVWTGDSWNHEVDSPVLIYLHSLCAYGNTGVLEEETWLKLWPSSHDSSGAYIGLKDRVIQTPEGDTGWLYVLPNGAVDPPPVSWNCPLAEGCRYWNAVPGSCAYNYFVPDSYTEISYNAPNHAVYLNGLIRYLKDEYNVDEDRVFIFGYSNGGYMTHFSGDVELEEQIKNDLAVTVRCIPSAGQGLPGQDEPGTCPFTGKPSACRVLWAKSD